MNGRPVTHSIIIIIYIKMKILITWLFYQIYECKYLYFQDNQTVKPNLLMESLKGEFLEKSE